MISDDDKTTPDQSAEGEDAQDAESDVNQDDLASDPGWGDLSEQVQTPLNPTELSEVGMQSVDRPLDAVYEVPVQVSAVLGKTYMPVNQLLKLGRGAVVELDRRVGEAIDIYVNDKLIARGEVVLVEDRLGVTMTEIIKSDRAS